METDYKILGLYSPYFMFIDMNEDSESTYIHEYIHYLQNVSTTFGIYQYAFARKNLLMMIISNQKGEGSFKTPTVLTEIQIFSENFGDNRNQSLVYDFIDISSIDFNFSKNPNNYRKVRTTAIINFLHNCKHQSYIFDVKTIKENMARLIENHCYPLQNIDKTLLYNICADVVSAYCPQFPITPQNLVALCDISLLSLTPVDTFFSLLELFDKSFFSLDNPRNIYKFYMKHVNFIIDEQTKLDFPESLKLELDNCIKLIESLCEQHDIYLEYAQWLKEVFDNAIHIRIDNPYFLINIFDYDYIKAQNKVIGYMKLLKKPLTIWMNRNVYFDTDTNAPGNYFLTLAEKEIYECLSRNSKKYSCTLQDMCKQNSSKSIVNYLCNNAIEKSKIGKGSVCPFIYLWLIWRLKDIQ